MSDDQPQNPRGKFGGLTTPLSLRGIAPWMVYAMAGLGLLYIINPTAGIIELLPDNLPLIGNLDEAGAATMLWYGLIEFFEGRKYRPTK